MGRKNLKEALAARHIHRPPALVYWALGYLWKALFVKRLGVRITYKVDPRKYRKGPYIVVSNHASRMDYIYTGCAFLPERLNYTAGYNEFFRSHLALVFRLLQPIPKRNFVPDRHTLRECARILEKEGKVIIFPEGMSSIGGANQPVALGSGGFLKYFKVPVLMTKIKGGYLTNTKYCLDVRPGRVEVEVDLLFTPADLEALSAEEVQAKLDEVLYHDDYAWNKEARVRFDGAGRMAHNLHHLLYRCPSCGTEFRMKGEGDTIRCLACGAGAALDEYYDLRPLTPASVVPATPKAWWDEERRVARAEVATPGFELREEVSLGIIPDHEFLTHQATSRPAGKGSLVLNREGLTYTGTKDGEPFTFHVQTHHLPTYGMCTDVSFFYTFYKGEYYEFTPAGETVGKWLLCTEEIHRLNGGLWKDFPWAT